MRKIMFPLLVTPSVAPPNADNGQSSGPKPLRVGDILANMLQPTQQEGGVTFEVMETWVPLARKLRKAESSILLEDAEHTLLESRLSVTKWLVANEDVIAVGRAVKDAEAIEIEESPAGDQDEDGQAGAVEEDKIAEEAEAPVE